MVSLGRTDHAAVGKISEKPQRQFCIDAAADLRSASC
jgi:hypothetical protein